MKYQRLAFVLVVGMILALIALLALMAYWIETDDGVILEQSRRKEATEYYIEGPTSFSFGAIFFEPKY